MLQAFLFNHIWGNKNIEPLQRCGANGRTQHSSKMQINNTKYLCTALWADLSSHTPPASPWAAPLTCRHTFKWVDQNHGYCQKHLWRKNWRGKARSPLPLPHFYQFLVDGSPHLRVFAHDPSEIKDKQKQRRLDLDNSSRMLDKVLNFACFQ